VDDPLLSCNSRLGVRVPPPAPETAGHRPVELALPVSRSFHADLNTIFGPTSLAIHSVQVAAELGDGREVLRRAKSVKPTRLPSHLVERRSHHLIDVARGHAHEPMIQPPWPHFWRPNGSRPRKYGTTR
jgi:hypothetical protein